MPIENLLNNKVAIITGAGRGIGKAAAKRLAEAGASVVLAARTEAEIQAVAEEIKATGGRALAIPTDVTCVSAVDNLVTLTLRAYQHIDILINNAAVLSPVGKTWEVDPEAWRKLIDINVVGPYLCARTVLPQMLDRDDGRIINISSGAANSDTVGWSAYNASKAALNRFTTTLAAEVAHTDIVVSAIGPGVVETSMQAQLRQSNNAVYPWVERFRQYHQKGQLFLPDEPAQLILWLASKHGADQNGVVLELANEKTREQIAQDLGLPLIPNRRG
ncbi:MAG TPA: SDR family oxidoreductase [Chloroflexi bacterium]|nr:SDR family oxidoreductase [Chloroflexota bacterium]